MIKQDPAQTRNAGTTRGLLVAAQLALSLMLLVGAGLMARAFVGMRSLPLGFDPSRAVTMQVALQVQRFNAGSLEEAKLKRLEFYHALANSAREIPGVEQAGIGLFVPMSGGPMAMQFALGPDQPARPAVSAIALAGFLEALRVPLVAGRYFTPEEDNRPVAIVDRQLADEVWPRQSAVGRRLLILRTTGEPTWVDVVGVVNHVQLDGLRASRMPEIFVTYATRQYTGLNIVVRGANPLSLVPAVRLPCSGSALAGRCTASGCSRSTSLTRRPTRGSRSSSSGCSRCWRLCSPRLASTASPPTPPLGAPAKSPCVWRSARTGAG
jgi:putative ABC transport system permease protein